MNKAALKLIRHCPTKYLVEKKKNYGLLKRGASSSIFCTKKTVKYFIVLIMKPTLGGFLYIKKKYCQAKKKVKRKQGKKKEKEV